MARINYIYLFEFDPRTIDTAIDIFNDAVDETLVFLLLMLIYYKVSGLFMWGVLDRLWELISTLHIFKSSRSHNRRRVQVIFLKLFHLGPILSFWCFMLQSA